MGIEAEQTNSPPRPNSGYLSQEDLEQKPKQPWKPEHVLSTLRHRPSESTTTPIHFFHLLERLKTTKREGWRRFGIDRGESIADHMYRMSLITMLAPPSLQQTLNIAHCTKMALVHDMAESLVGDITPVDGVSKAEKSRREEETMRYICKGLLGSVDGGMQGEELARVWREYEDDETREAHFVHDVDKMELILQMLEYERSHEGRIDLGEFCWVKSRIQLPEVVQWAEDVMAEREAFWKSVGKVPGKGRPADDKKIPMLEEYYSKNEAKR